MNKINLELPINNLSFGNVSINILRELYKRGFKVSLWPIGNIDISVFDKLDNGFKEWLSNSINNRITTLDHNLPVLKLWHLDGAWNKIADKQYLFTFYETDMPTDEELNIVNQQEKTILSSNYSIDIFKSYGIEESKLAFVPLGFDPDLSKTPRTYDNDIIHFGLMGKWENRKNTARIINLWAKKFGRDKRYRLSCCVLNPFLGNSVEEIKNNNMALFNQALEGQQYWNINLLPYLKTNSEVNNFLNNIDVDLSGISGGEGWGLPSFNSTALGKWSIVSNCSAHKDWATEKNSILLKTSGKIPSHDGMFFVQGRKFSQGNFFKITDETILEGFERALKLAKTPNIEGEKLRNEFSYENTVNSLLKIIV